MATAPRPGASERLAIEAAQSEMMDSGFRVVCPAENKDVTILFGDLSSEDEIACLNEVGFPPMELAQRALGVTSVLVFYWLALRQVKQKDPPKLQKLLRKYGTPRKLTEAGFEIHGIGVFAEVDDDGEEGEERLDPSESESGSATPGPDGPSSTGSDPGTQAVPGS